MTRLAIITSHPIQYNAPVFAMLAGNKKIAIKVFYTWGQTQEGIKFDPGFGKNIEWDLPLLQGYEYTFVRNISVNPSSGYFKGIINPTLINEIEGWHADAILVFGWSFQSHLRCLRHFHKKIPVLFRGDSTLLDETGIIKTRLRRLFLKWVYRHVDHAFYTGTHNKDYFLKHGLREKQLHFTPHAIDNARFAEPGDLYAEQALAKRSNMGIRESDLVVLFAGKLEPKKNPFLLLGVSSAIRDDQLKILYVGNGILEMAIKQAAAGDSRVLFMDFQNQLQMPVVYRMADLFILPSRGPGETWGLAVNEAMACGLPVIVSDKVGCAPDLVSQNSNGIIFHHDDPGPVIALLERVLQNKNELQAMGRESKKKIADFSFIHIVQSIEQLVTNIAC